MGEGVVVRMWPFLGFLFHQCNGSVSQDVGQELAVRINVFAFAEDADASFAQLVLDVPALSRITAGAECVDAPAAEVEIAAAIRCLMTGADVCGYESKT